MIYTGRNQNLKIEAYELCPCDSGEKYKFCCYKKTKSDDDLKRKTMLSYPDKRLGHVTSSFWGKSDFKTCYGFDLDKCNGKIIGAHSIQNNRILNRLSEDSHVYSIDTHVSFKQVRPEFKRISRNDASTFFGFCKHHDTEIFKPIELKEYKNEPLQNFLFAFRALTIEVHKKRRQLTTIKNLFKEFPSLMASNECVYVYRISQLDDKHYQYYHTIFKTIYECEGFRDITTINYQLNYETSFATSTAFSVQFDLKGKEINDKSDIHSNVALI